MCGELPSLLGTSRDPMWKSAVLADLRDLKREQHGRFPPIQQEVAYLI